MIRKLLQLIFAVNLTREFEFRIFQLGRALNWRSSSAQPIDSGERKFWTYSGHSTWATYGLLCLPFVCVRFSVRLTTWGLPDKRLLWALPENDLPISVSIATEIRPIRYRRSFRITNCDSQCSNHVEESHHLNRYPNRCRSPTKALQIEPLGTRILRMRTTKRLHKLH